VGIEIGVGAQTIAPVTRTVLTDGFSSHAGNRSLAQLFCRADSIPCGEGSFDFLLSEHVLEHLCDPLRALYEWRRVLKPGGVVFLFLPHAERTFDRARPRTPLDHLIADFKAGVTDPDHSHLEEWMEKVIRPGLAPHYSEIPPEEQLRLGIIHHHVWITEDVVEFLGYAGFEPLQAHNSCPDRNDSLVVVAKAGDKSRPAS
jgi:SAM-dependent methyltransferase